MKKRFLSVILTAAMVVTMLAGCGGSSSSNSDSSGDSKTAEQSTEAASDDASTDDSNSEESSADRIGMLTMLNLSEEAAEVMITSRFASVGALMSEEGYVTNGDDSPANSDFAEDTESEARESQKEEAPNVEVVYYDNLNSMVMGLKSGDIMMMWLYQTVAEYLSAQDDAFKAQRFNEDKERNDFAEFLAEESVYGFDFSFLMRDDENELCDEFNEAIDAMEKDGTLDALEEKQIDAVIAGEDIEPVEIEEIEGADTITVAVTGDLPPLDYISDAGEPAGYNTAVLAEISKRIGKNIKLVQVDAGARATALATGSVDAVFWALTRNDGEALYESSEEQQEAWDSADLTDEERDALYELQENAEATGLDLLEYYASDMPDNTILTNSYYSDYQVMVMYMP